VRRHLAAALLLLGAVLAAAPADAAGAWGWVGVRIRDLTEQEMDDISRKFGLREGFGAMVVEVLKDTPAEAAGIHPGDVIVAVRNRPIVDTRALQREIGAAAVGDPVPLTVLRKDQGRRPVSVTVGAMPDAVVAERVAAEYGFFVGELELTSETSGGTRPPVASPSVTGVLPKSRAATAGLRTGDVFVEVNGHPVGTLSALRDALVGVRPDGPLSLVIRRDRERVTVSLDHAGR